MATTSVLETRRVPTVVAHRGASGHLPEHTLAAYELAILQGADYLEPDLVATRDGQLVVRHENWIDQTTDVAARRDLAGRRTTKIVDGVTRTGWFTEDLTLAELRSLHARERLPGLRPGSAAFDDAYGVVGLEEVLDLVRRTRGPGGRQVRVLAELKHPTYFARLGVDLPGRLLADLDGSGLDHDAVMVQSFETACLRLVSRRSALRVGQLLEPGGRPHDLLVAGDPRTTGDLLGPAGLHEISGYADVVGLDKRLIVARDDDGRLLGPTGVVDRAHDAGLEVYGWTFRGEGCFLPPELRSGDDPAAPGDLAAEVAAHLDAGMDGVITDHPDLVRPVPTSRPGRPTVAAAG